MKILRPALAVLGLLTVAGVCWGSSSGHGVVSDVSANSTSNGTVHISWTTNSPDLRVLIFRSGIPIKGVSDLRRAVLLNSLSGVSVYSDAPPPGLAFYYAVTGESDYFQDSPFDPAGATAGPVEVPLSLQKNSQLFINIQPSFSSGDASRPLPLPVKETLIDPLTGKKLTLSRYAEKFQTPLSAPVRQVLQEFDAPPPATDLPPVSMLQQDSLNNLTGLDRRLAQIVQTSFKSEDWSSCTARLNALSDLPLSTSTRSRLQFYLAQALAKQSHFRRATLALLSSDPGRDLKNLWLKALLARLPQSP